MGTTQPRHFCCSPGICSVCMCLCEHLCKCVCVRVREHVYACMLALVCVCVCVQAIIEIGLIMDDRAKGNG